MNAMDYLKQLNPKCKEDINKLHDKVEKTYQTWRNASVLARSYFEPIVDSLLENGEIGLAKDVLGFMPECPDRNLLYRKIEMFTN